MNKATLCEPAHEILENMGVPCKPVKDCEGMRIVDPPHATARLIASAYEAGTKVLNLTRVVDLILRGEGALEGVVVNNTTAEMAGHDVIHVDPIALESKVVVDATGHDAVVVGLLNQRGLLSNGSRQRSHVGCALRGHGCRKIPARSFRTVSSPDWPWPPWTALPVWARLSGRCCCRENAPPTSFVIN